MKKSKKKLKILLLANYSRAFTGFGKAMKNICLALYNDPEIEIIEAANGISAGQDLRLPWKAYGTMTQNAAILNSIKGDPQKERANQYGFYEIDNIIEKERPDVFIGIEDIWAFFEFDKKPWWNTINKVIWTTIDSIPIYPWAVELAPKTDAFMVWASFAQKEMRKLGVSNVDVLHGPVDLTHFKPLSKDKKEQLKKFHKLDDCYIVGFVFKNQLRKSVTNLIDGFEQFKKVKPNAKLLLHTDWSEVQSGWDIPRYLREKGLDNKDFLASYVCHKCNYYFVNSYEGEQKNCPLCRSEKSVFTKTSGKGVSEQQLNEIYNLMDVYCHPFTSGGQEIPLQEAKAAGLITLTTSYSCGLDNCFPSQGGLPLDWKEYREPQTQFIKATTLPESICEQLTAVANMSEEEKNTLISNGLKYVEEEFSVPNVVKKLRQKILSFKPVDWPEKIESVKNTTDFNSFFDENDGEKENRIAVIMKESAGDILMINSMIDNLSELYPDDKIFVVTSPQFFHMIEDHPKVHKMIPYLEGLDNLLFLEGIKEHKGFFKCAWIAGITTQKHLAYLHNGVDKSQFQLYDF